MGSRRKFIQKVSAGASALMVACKVRTEGPSQSSVRAVREQGSTDRAVFSCGVASGDPHPRGAVLWTRINPKVFPGSVLPNVTVRVYGGNSFDDINGTEICSLEVSASDYAQRDSDGNNANDYCLQVRIDDAQLQPFSFYFYQFEAVYDDDGAGGSYVSEVGRFKTLPDRDQNIAAEDINFGLLTCQDMSTGYLTAYRALANNEDVDYVLHLGDFIYEYDIYHGHQNLDGRSQGGFADGRNWALTQDEFQRIYRNFREDADGHLREAMRKHTFIITWDDHETHNDWYWDYSAGRIGIDPRTVEESPALTHPDNLILMKNSAQRAWMNYVPFFQFDPEHPQFPSAYQGTNKYIAPIGRRKDTERRLQIWRKFRFGSKVELFMTDSRSYRSKVDQPGGLPPTMLGDEQKAWLMNGIANSDATWKLWGNQTLLTPLSVGDEAFVFSHEVNKDSWGGYPDERKEILSHFKNRGVRGLVVVTGDMHTALSTQLESGITFNDMGAEFMTPAVSSPNIRDSITHSGASSPPAGIEGMAGAALAALNPDQIQYLNGNIYGYSTLRFTKDSGGSDKAVFIVYAVESKTSSSGYGTTIDYACSHDWQSRDIDDITSSMQPG